MSIERQFFDLLGIEDLQNVSNMVRDRIIKVSKSKGLNSENILKNIIETIEDMGLSNDIKESLISRAKKDFESKDEPEKSKVDLIKNKADYFERKFDVVYDQIHKIHERQTKADEQIKYLKDMVDRMFINLEEFERNIQNHIYFLNKKFDLEN